MLQVLFDWFFIKIGVEGSFYYLMMLKKKKLVHNILIGLSDLLYLLDKLRECAPFVIYGYVKGVFCNSDMNLKNESV